jgi:caffeoyl-CoA O-methyltransferase
MSSTGTFVTAAHYAYVAARTPGDDEFLINLKDAACAVGIPPIWISAEQASLIQVLLKLSSAREVVEVGTLAGYSAITMARGLPHDGRVRTIELEPTHADFAEEWIGRSDVASKVELLRGVGADVLADLEDGSADAVFLDADKANYEVYLEHALRILRPGGLVMADNAFAFGKLFDASSEGGEIPAVRAFNDHVPTIEGLHAVIVPIGDGMWVGVREG